MNQPDPTRSGPADQSQTGVQRRTVLRGDHLLVNVSWDASPLVSFPKTTLHSQVTCWSIKHLSLQIWKNCIVFRVSAFSLEEISQLYYTDLHLYGIDTYSSCCFCSRNSRILQAVHCIIVKIRFETLPFPLCDFDFGALLLWRIGNQIYCSLCALYRTI